MRACAESMTSAVRADRPSGVANQGATWSRARRRASQASASGKEASGARPHVTHTAASAPRARSMEARRGSSAALTARRICPSPGPCMADNTRPHGAVGIDPQPADSPWQGHGEVGDRGVMVPAAGPMQGPQRR